MLDINDDENDDNHEKENESDTNIEENEVLAGEKPDENTKVNVREGEWVKVQYEGEWFLGKVLKCVASSCPVRCLEKPFGIKDPQDMEPEADAVYYDMKYGMWYMKQGTFNPN